jgi:parallel beta-helix repeat protein
MSIYGFTIQNARYGIRLESSSGSIISNNIFTSNRIEGISIANSSNNTISDNTVRNNNYGIGLHWTLSAPGPCTYNTIINNIITDNHYRGIEISLYHRYNKIIGNTISNNTKYGIKICCICNDNIIYHNNFKDNGQNAEDSYNNTWDNGYPSGGNYWDDYNGSDIDNDGIGDTPYDISGGNNQDAYPLMVPWNENQPPNKPIISGPIFGKVGVEYKWSFISTDPDMDDIYYQIKWCGINSSQELVGPYSSGEKIFLNYSYSKNGQYTIYAKAIDIYDTESDWRNFNIIILKNKICHEFLLINLFEKLCFFQKIFSFFNKN